MSSSSAIPEIEADAPYLYLFNQEELVVYLDLKAACKDESLSKEQRKKRRKSVTAKLKHVIDTRMSAAEREASEAANLMMSNSLIPESEADTPGLYLFKSNELVIYLSMKAASKDKSLPTKQQDNNRRNAVRKLNNVIEQRMPMAEKLVLAANKQAVEIQFIEKAMSLSTPKQREDYAARLVSSTDPKKTKVQQQSCAAGAMYKLKDIIAKQIEKEKRAAMNSEELQEYDNDPERVAAKAEKAHINQVGSVKHRGKEAVLCNEGDPDAIARRAARNEAQRKWRAAKRQEMFAEIAELFRKHGNVSTVFGEGDERQESIMRKVKEIMGNYAGVAHPIGETTSKKWLNDHGDVSIEEKLAEGEWAAYILITRTGIIPGKEEECRETKVFITDVGRDPLWRMELENGDLKRMSPPQANSVVHSYLLAECDSAYDVTSLEAACQFYLEDIGLPHGMCLHRQAGSGNRLENSFTQTELDLFLSGEKCGYSLVLSIIRVTDCVFAAVDPDDPERSPPLVSASVPAHDGTDMVHRIRVRGNKQSFPDTPSVVEDRATNNVKNEKDKARRQERKRNAAESVDRAESPEEMEEKTAKKSKI
jgi:hypothetical protein